MNYFTLFDLPVQYALDNHKLVVNYQLLQRQYHPDRFVSAPDDQKLAAVQQAATINNAYKTLKTPLTRALYFLSLQGINALDETDTICETQFLTEQLNFREQLEHINTESELIEFGNTINIITEGHYTCLANVFAEQDWSTATLIIQKLHFFDKLQQRIVQIEDRLLNS